MRVGTAARAGIGRRRYRTGPALAALFRYGVSAAAVVGATICAVALPATWASRFLGVPAVGGRAAPNDATRASKGGP